MNSRAALVLDYDGTVIDSSDVKQRAFHTAISDAITVPIEVLQEAYQAHGTLNRVPQLYNAFRDVLGRNPDSHELDGMVSRYTRFVREHGREFRPFEGMPEFLATHQKRYYLVVASNAPQDELAESCESLGLEPYFDRIYGFPTSKEDAIGLVCSEFSLPKCQVLYIGDRSEDRAIAERSGVPFVRFGPNEPADGTVINRTLPELAQAIASAGLTE